MVVLLQTTIAAGFVLGVLSIWIPVRSRIRRLALSVCLLCGCIAALLGVLLWQQASIERRVLEAQGAELIMAIQTASVGSRTTQTELSRHPIVGELGIPLGTVAEIRAIVHDGDALGTKEHADQVMLKVEQVDGKVLTHGPILGYSVKGWAEISTPLAEVRAEDWRPGIDRAAVRGSIGKSVRLVVYESGRYVGAPDKIPPDIGDWSDTGFYFQTYLVVLGERKDAK